MRIPLRLSALQISLSAALVLAAGAALAGPPKSPLGKWMKPNMSAPLAASDYDALKKSFDVVASKVPSGDYANWAQLAQQGSSAAAGQDLKGVKASCKGCHDAYKDRYLKEHATTPFP
jgi:hypothetical protein